MQQLLDALPDLQPEAERRREVTPKLSYKDQMDILWSLEKTADQLDHSEGDDKETARKSAKRLRKLRERLGGTW